MNKKYKIVNTRTTLKGRVIKNISYVTKEEFDEYEYIKSLTFQQKLDLLSSNLNNEKLISAIIKEESLDATIERFSSF